MTRRPTRTRVWSRAQPTVACALAAIIAALWATGAGAIEPDEPTATDQATIGAGHVDVGPRFVDGAWTVQVRDDTVRPPVWRNLADVVLEAVDAARIDVPQGDEFSFLGEPGEGVWVLPQVEDRGILWPGWNTQDPEVVERVERDVTWTLHGVAGPGRFTLFETEGFGEPRVLFDGDGELPQTLAIELDTHVHGNWAFSEPGVYLLDVEMSATVDGGQAVAARDALRLVVGDGDPSEALAAALPAADGDRFAGIPPGAWLAAGVAAVAIALGAVLMLLRRRRSAPAEGA